MKIGQFAEKHGITQDTIRHYLDMGLLVTKKEGAHYRFSEADSDEINKIMELKQLDFSLSKIQEILCFHRLAGDKTDEYRNYYLSVLEEKREEITNEQEKYRKINSDISHRIKTLKINELNKTKSLGLPMPSLDILGCPNCNGILDIYDGIIERNMIINANVKCECNYNAIVENGIYVDVESARKKTLNGKDMPSKKEFLDAASPKFINFYYDGMAMLIDNIRKHSNKPKYIMELESCVGTFLMQYIKYLPNNSTYILIGNDKDRLANLKSNIELHHEHMSFIFFCCDINRLPIKDLSIDIMVDHWMTKDYVQSNGEFLPKSVSPLLKEGGLLTGAYPYFNINSKDFYSIPVEIKDYFNKDKVMEKLEELNFTRIDSADIGPVIETNPYNVDTQGKELYLTIYAGQKAKDN